MTKRVLKKNLKKNLTKRKRYIRKTKKNKKRNYTKKIKRGGDVSEEYNKKQLFRRNFNNLIIQINNGKNVKQAVNNLINLFNKNELINTLIPITTNGKPVDKETYSLAKNPVTISDFVSPIIVIFDNLTDKITDEQLIKILNAYYINSGNFNNLSSRFKISPFKNELNKERINNVKILLNESNNFHIYEEGLDEETRDKLAELIPNEQKILTESEIKPIQETKPIQESTPIQESQQTNNKLNLPYPLPDNNEIGYDKSIVPEFWKPIFQNGNELLEIRDGFMGNLRFR